ncbi:MAG: multi-sensor signal transduction histidine kinase, partial [bacterium]|nr:multi-sensor signal transduction histidine kinase [bacterium]
MPGIAQRASGWLRGRVRALVEWPCRAELATLREQKRRFVAVLDAVEDAVVLSGPDDRLRFANRAAASLLRDLTGRDPASLVGKSPAELGLPAELARFLSMQTERLNRTRVAFTNEVVVPRRGGGGRWYEQKLSPVFTDGRLTAHIMIGRDIDARKRAQRRLELLSKVSLLVGDLELDELLPAIAKLAIPELADWSAVDICGDQTTVRRVSVAHRDPGKATLAAQLQRFHPWRSRAGWSDLLAGRSLLFPEVSDEILRANAEDAEHLALMRQLGLCSVIMVPLRVRGATVAVMTFATSDESACRFSSDDLALAEELARRAAIIIDRARLHEELKTSEARFRVALAASRTAVFEQDRELRYRWHYNAVVDRDAVGKTHADFFPKDEAELLTALKRRVLDSGEKVRDEVQLTTGAEARVWAMAIDPLRDEGGAIVGLIGAATDVTDEKRVQAELAQAVTFREQLMSILGHDLRNPLGAILAATGLLRRLELAQPARDHVDRLDRAAWRMAELIRTLLDVAYVRFHGSLPVAPEPTDLAEIARAIVDELLMAEPDRAIELEVRGDARGRWDQARLGEVLSNLVGNALVHGAADEPVRVAIDVSSDEVWLRVHNGGEAITPDMKAALFEPFRRGTPDDGSSRALGLGLGLYIVRQIVLAHGGAITVDSTPA